MVYVCVPFFSLKFLDSELSQNLSEKKDVQYCTVQYSTVHNYTNTSSIQSNKTNTQKHKHIKYTNT